MTLSVILKRYYMEATTQIHYNGNSAFYRITSLNHVRFHAVLTDFLGKEKDIPPKQIDFTHYNHNTTIINYSERTVKKSDVVNVANALMAQLFLQG